MKKFIFPIILSVSLILLFAACSASKEPVVSSSTAVTQAQTTENTTESSIQANSPTRVYTEEESKAIAEFISEMQGQNYPFDILPVFDTAMIRYGSSMEELEIGETTRLVYVICEYYDSVIQFYKDYYANWDDYQETSSNDLELKISCSKYDKLINVTVTCIPNMYPQGDGVLVTLVASDPSK